MVMKGGELKNSLRLSEFPLSGCSHACVSAGCTRFMFHMDASENDETLVNH